MDTQTAMAAANAVTIAGRSFCFTGRATRSRREMELAVTERGGTVTPRVTRGTDYLVVGDRGSKRWKYKSGSPESEACWGGGTYGRKLARARRIIAAGGGIRIVGEAAFWSVYLREIN